MATSSALSYTMLGSRSMSPAGIADQGGKCGVKAGAQVVLTRCTRTAAKKRRQRQKACNAVQMQANLHSRAMQGSGSKTIPRPWYQRMLRSTPASTVTLQHARSAPSVLLPACRPSPNLTEEQSRAPAALVMHRVDGDKA